MKRFRWLNFVRTPGLLLLVCIAAALLWIALTQYPTTAPADPRTNAGIAVTFACALLLQFPRSKSVLARCYYGAALVSLGLVALFALVATSVFERVLSETLTGVIMLSYYVGSELIRRRDRRRLQPPIERQD